MKKLPRGVKIEFWVSKLQKNKIVQNMERNGMSNLSEFMRLLALSDAEISFSVKVPNVIRVSEAHLGLPREAGKEGKRAVG